MSDQDDDPKSIWLRNLQKKLDTSNPPSEYKTREMTPTQSLAKKELGTIMPIDITDDIKARANLYKKAEDFLARSDKDNLILSKKNKELINNNFDTIAAWSFYGSIVGVCAAGFGLMVGSPIAFWLVLSSFTAGSSYVFDKLAHKIHTKEIESKREDATLEYEDKLNQYAHLLDEAIKYINAQILLWNLRSDYLFKNLAEQTSQDEQRYRELHNISIDFRERANRLVHLFLIQSHEKHLTSRGIDLDGLHNRLSEYLIDLKPILPKISTDPIMLLAIQEMNDVFEEYLPPKPESASVEITIDDDKNSENK